MTIKLVCTSPYKVDMQITCPPCDYGFKEDVNCCRNCPKGSGYRCNTRCGWLEEKGEIKTMITNIEIKKISRHPDNPRKDLGDLSELAESIKANGILQNLTVVPWFSKFTGVGADDPKQQEELGYIVVIGHRRLAAAELAGLTEVPCIISDMDHKKQIATMLLENMQRNDLTVWEQAQGFQMMLNFGETVDDISAQTGFSGNTIRRRVKLLDLDKDKFKKSVERGATLQDYAELDKIKDIKTKNAVLDKVGTSNFQWELRNAIDKETKEENKALLIAKLKKFATQVEKETSGMLHTKYFSNFLNLDTKYLKPDDADEREYFFVVSHYDIQLLVKKTPDMETESEKSIKQERKQQQERYERLNEINKRAFQLRHDFIQNYKGVKKHANVIMAWAVQAIIQGGLACGDDEFLKILGVEPPEDDDEITFDTVSSAFDSSPERVLLIAAYCGTENRCDSYHNWQCKFVGNEDIDATYDFLEKIGYKISDEERALRNGTHELYVCEDEAE